MGACLLCVTVTMRSNTSVSVPEDSTEGVELEDHVSGALVRVFLLNLATREPLNIFFARA
jgi:hypothetical protein